MTYSSWVPRRKLRAPFAYRSFLFVKLSLALLLPGCFGYAPAGAPGADAATTTTNEVLIRYIQTWSKAFSDSHPQHKTYFIVHANGESEEVDSAPPVLAIDCSDSTPQNGLCIPSTHIEDMEVKRDSYALPDGSRIDFDVRGKPGFVLTRTARDGSVMWQRDQIEEVPDAIREWKLLVVKKDKPSTVELLRIDTGEPIWSIEAPDKID